MWNRHWSESLAAEQRRRTGASSTPVRAKDFVLKFTDTEETLILTKNRRPTVTPLDDNSFDEWNADSWEDSTTLTVDSMKGDKAPQTDVKQLAGSEAPGPSHPSGGAQRKTGFSVNPNRPSATIAGTPAGFKDFEDYFNPRIFSSLPLYATSPSFPAAVNLRSHPPCQQGGAQGRPKPWDNRPYGRKTRSQEALRARAERKVQRRFLDYKN